MEIKKVYELVSKKLKEGSIEDFEFEARQLLYYRVNCSFTDIVTNKVKLSDDVFSQLLIDCDKRLSGYPLQYILGEWEFYSLPFKVGEGVLIPRADTECLCDYVLEAIKGKSGLKILDLCSGSGCIGICLDTFTSHENTVFLLEKSPKAQEYIKKNVALNNSNAILLCDDAISPQTKEKDFDIIVSNPPYLTKADMKSLQREVSFEPKMALYGLRDDGLAFYEEIARIWKDRLKDGGMLVFEVGINQHNAVASILKENGYKNICFNRDLCGIIRNVIAEH